MVGMMVVLMDKEEMKKIKLTWQQARSVEAAIKAAFDVEPTAESGSMVLGDGTRVEWDNKGMSITPQQGEEKDEDS